MTATGEAFRIRPLAVEDAAFVVKLRSDPALFKVVHPVSSNVADQERWTRAYFEREGDYCFIVERLDGGTPEGMAGIWEVTETRDVAQWGRWVMLPTSLGGVESALLVYRCAFEVLGLGALYCRTVATNTAVLSFHDACGLERQRVVEGAFSLPTGQTDAIEHVLRREKWPAARAVLAPQAARVAKILARRRA